MFLLGGGYEGSDAACASRPRIGLDASAGLPVGPVDFSIVRTLPSLGLAVRAVYHEFVSGMLP